jgi:hypothetical protein
LEIMIWNVKFCNRIACFWFFIVDSYRSW